VRATFRIDPEIWSALEREAARSGRTLTGEIEGRLRESLQGGPERLVKRAFKRVPDRALAYLVASLSRVISINAADRDPTKMDQYNWRRDRFCFEALRVGIDVLLTRLAPDSEMQVPTGALEATSRYSDPQAVKYFRTPQGVGTACANGLWDQLTLTPEPPLGHSKNMHYAEQFWEMFHVRRALGLPEPKDEDADTIELHGTQDGHSKVVRRKSATKRGGKP